ncbi:hypothetical protein [uncultured Brachyspira sp.]|uniref:hypothetical protein n=1 Tax=uncultured Brachyspira sp. TaxID=221953 RepID=UPI0026041B39|nr:hypothetical protein [uncultured Brachyspira sp.]
MKKKIIILSSFISIFILSCFNNDSIVKLNKYAARYEGTINTTSNVRQLITNKCTLIVNEDSSIEITIEGGNVYDKKLTISKEELVKTDDISYNTSKDGNNYTFVFHDTYMTLRIENTDNTVSEGKLSKIE